MARRTITLPRPKRFSGLHVRIPKLEFSFIPDPPRKQCTKTPCKSIAEARCLGPEGCRCRHRLFTRISEVLPPTTGLLFLNRWSTPAPRDTVADEMLQCLTLVEIVKKKMGDDDPADNEEACELAANAVVSECVPLKFSLE